MMSAQAVNLRQRNYSRADCPDSFNVELRRNTSKPSLDPLRGCNKAATCCCSVAAFSKDRMPSCNKAATCSYRSGRKSSYWARSPEPSFETTNAEIAVSTPRPCGTDKTADPWEAIERLKKDAQARSQFRKQLLLKTFTPSNQYNLTRLSPGEAEAI
jgi:hypothetical protein